MGTTELEGWRRQPVLDRCKKILAPKEIKIKKGLRHLTVSPCIFWLPLVDALRNQFLVPSKELMNTILVAQGQVKDGFLAAGQ